MLTLNDIYGREYLNVRVLDVEVVGTILNQRGAYGMLLRTPEDAEKVYWQIHPPTRRQRWNWDFMPRTAESRFAPDSFIGTNQWRSSVNAARLRDGNTIRVVSPPFDGYSSSLGFFDIKYWRVSRRRRFTSGEIIAVAVSPLQKEHCRVFYVVCRGANSERTSYVLTILTCISVN